MRRSGLIPSLLCSFIRVYWRTYTYRVILTACKENVIKAIHQCHGHSEATATEGAGSTFVHNAWDRYKQVESSVQQKDH